MVVQTPGVGVEHGTEAEFGVEFAMVEAESFQSGGDGVEHRAIEGLRLAVSNRSEGRWQGEGCHEVVNGEQFGLLSVEPLGRRVVLALRATAMSARAHAVAKRITLGAAHRGDTEGAGATVGDGVQSLTLMCRQLMAVAFDERRHCDVHEFGEG